MDRHGDPPEQGDRTFGSRGWILIIAILLAFLLIPGLITFYPPTWLSYRFAYLILPAIPAILLAIIAVWATTRP